MRTDAFYNKFFNGVFHAVRFPQILNEQWRLPEAVTALQDRRLRKIVGHAYLRVPYYRALFDSLNMKPSDIQGKQDLQRLPVLTKDSILKNYPENILATNRDQIACSSRMTSGSSGKKLEVVLDHRLAALYRLMQLRQLIDVGYKPWDRIAYIRYGPPVTKVFLQKIGFFRRHYIPLEWSPERQLSEVMKYKPQIINAYPSVLYLLARSISTDKAKKLGLKFLLSNSELLTQHVREKLENVFQCKVYDDYSCLEFSAIAFECRMQNLHIASDNVIVEILDEEGNNVPIGDQGRIIITSLNNYSMPYIRYEIGDIGILSKETCSCGRNFPILSSIIGRCDDFVVMPSGRLMDPQTVVFQIEVIPEVKEFRIIQEEDYHITVNIVPEEGTEFSKIKGRIKTALDALFNGVLTIKVNRVLNLERGGTGKHKSVICKISKND